MSLNPVVRKNTKGIYSIRYKGKELFPDQAVENRIKSRIQNYQIQNKSLIFVPSPLLFTGFEHLLSEIGPDNHIFCVEIDQNLMSLSCEYSSAQFLDSSQITYIRTDTKNGILKTIHGLGPWNFRTVQMLSIGKGYSLFPSQYKEMFSAASHFIQQYWQNKMTLIHMGNLWIKNIFRNLEFFRVESALSSIKTGKPVIVAGAGESLEASLPLIKKNRNKIFLISVDTALSALTLSGLSPDLVVVMETQLINLKDFIGQDLSKTIIVSDLSSHPCIHRLGYRKSLFFLSRFSDSAFISRLKGLLPGLDIFPALGSVGVAAVQCALEITSSSIFLSGLDFSYSLGKSHSRGTPPHYRTLHSANRFSGLGNYQSCVQRPLLKVADKNGEPCITDLILHSYARELTNLIYKRENVYDLRAKGLSLGIDNTHRDKDLQRLLKNKPPVHIDNKNISQGDHNKIIHFIENEISIIQRIIKTGKEYIQGKTHGVIPSALIEDLRTCDYIYISFPDPPPLPKQEIGFIKRAVISAEWYFTQLGQILSRLG